MAEKQESELKTKADKQESKLKIKPEEVLSAYLEKHKMRRTPERFAILQMATTLGGHFDIEELYNAMEADAYHVSRTTIYNAVELLCRCGLLRSLQIDSRSTVYEMADSDHAHLICMQCGKVRELRQPSITDALAAAKLGGFAVAYVSATAYGLCASCARKNRRKL